MTYDVRNRYCDEFDKVDEAAEDAEMDRWMELSEAEQDVELFAVEREYAEFCKAHPTTALQDYRRRRRSTLKHLMTVRLLERGGSYVPSFLRKDAQMRMLRARAELHAGRAIGGVQ